MPVVSADPLHDFRKRIAWADEDGAALHTELRGFINMNPYRTEFEIEGGQVLEVKGSQVLEVEGSQVTAIVCRTIDPSTEADVLDRCTRLIGSYLDHMRTALNYLVYQIAVFDQVTNSTVIPDSTELPIFKDAAAYAKGNRVKKLSAEYRKAIEAVQPYGGRRPGLWLLHELSRVHRHRLLHATNVATFDEFHSVDAQGGTIDNLEVLHSGPVGERTPVLRFTVAGDGAADGARVINARVGMGIGIDHPLCTGQQAMDAVNEITVAVTEVRKALAPLVP